jgi:TPR repeat protein
MNIKQLLTTTILLFSSAAQGQTDFEETKLLADQGDAIAQSNLGHMYYGGKNVPQSHIEAITWYRLAAEQGLAQAQFNLGLMYANGLGVPENDTEAVIWYRLAAEQGYAYAQNNLGLMYFNGAGTPQDDVRAYMWWSVSTAQGYAVARANRDIAADRLTPAQATEGQYMATKCFESDYQDCE